MRTCPADDGFSELAYPRKVNGILPRRETTPRSQAPCISASTVQCATAVYGARTRVTKKRVVTYKDHGRSARLSYVTASMKGMQLFLQNSMCMCTNIHVSPSDYIKLVDTACIRTF